MSWRFQPQNKLPEFYFTSSVSLPLSSGYYRTHVKTSHEFCSNLFVPWLVVHVCCTLVVKVPCPLSKNSHSLIFCLQSLDSVDMNQYKVLL